MRICIVGAGAMGSLFGALLQPVASVVLLDPWQAHVDAINRHGLHVTGLSGERLVPVKAVTAWQDAGPVDLAIVFVKSHQTAWAAEIAKNLLGPAGLALTLQNGLGNGDTLARIVGEDRTCVGVTAHGATLVGPGEVRHAGQGATHLSRTPVTATRVAAVAELFTRAGLETHVSDDLASLIWGKLVINVGINALTALMRVKNGVLEQTPPFRQVMDAAVEEAAAVARAKGIRLPYADPVEQVHGVCRATAGNRSSMLQDATRRQLTENDVINGAIVREAAAQGLAVPVNEALYGLVKGMEATYQVREE
jgi:2-dehydropantoate 2-reductase